MMKNYYLKGCQESGQEVVAWFKATSDFNARKRAMEEMTLCAMCQCELRRLDYFEDHNETPLIMQITYNNVYALN